MGNYMIGKCINTVKVVYTRSVAFMCMSPDHGRREGVCGDLDVNSKPTLCDSCASRRCREEAVIVSWWPDEIYKLRATRAGDGLYPIGEVGEHAFFRYEDDSVLSGVMCGDRHMGMPAYCDRCAGKTLLKKAFRVGRRRVKDKTEWMRVADVPLTPEQEKALSFRETNELIHSRGSTYSLKPANWMECIWLVQARAVGKEVFGF